MPSPYAVTVGDVYGGGDEGLTGNRTSVPHAEFLRLLCQRIQCFLAVLVAARLVGQKILVADAAVRPHLRVSDLALLEQFDEMRAGDVEDVGRLLRSQFGVGRYDGYRIALSHLGEQVAQQCKGLAREDQIGAVELDSGPVGLG